MRQDQFEKLEALSERLADRFISEADPDNWTAPAKLPADMTQQERGDSYWCRKNAMATGGVLRFVLDLHARAKTPTAGGGPDPEGDLDRQIAEAEKRAKAAVSRALERAKSGAG
jgi:hypothetical protein